MGSSDPATDPALSDLQALVDTDPYEALDGASALLESHPDRLAVLQTMAAALEAIDDEDLRAQLDALESLIEDEVVARSPAGVRTLRDASFGSPSLFVPLLGRVRQLDIPAADLPRLVASATTQSLRNCAGVEDAAGTAILSAYVDLDLHAAVPARTAIQLLEAARRYAHALDDKRAAAYIGLLEG